MKVRAKFEKEKDRRERMITREKGEAEVGKDLILVYPCITYE